MNEPLKPLWSVPTEWRTKAMQADRSVEREDYLEYRDILLSCATELEAQLCAWAEHINCTRTSEIEFVKNVLGVPPKERL